MIRVLCDFNDRNIVVKGHAGFDEYGKDIVCAAVSGIVQYFARVALRYDGKAVKSKGYLEVTYPEVLDTMADELVRVLEEIADRYPRNVSVEVRQR